MHELEKAVNEDNVYKVLDLLKLKIEYNYNWSNALNSSALNNSIKRNELEYWYKLFWLIVNSCSINVADEIVKLNWYSDGHLYGELLRKSLEKADILLVEKLLNKIENKIIIIDEIIIDFLDKNDNITKKHWYVINLLINDRGVSKNLLIRLNKYKSLDFIIKLLEISNVSLTCPDIILDLIDCDIDCDNNKQLLNFVLLQPSACLSENIIKYVNSSDDSISFLEKIIFNNEMNFIECLNLQDYIHYFYNLFENIEITNNNKNIIKYIINESIDESCYYNFFLQDIIDKVNKN